MASQNLIFFSVGSKVKVQDKDKRFGGYTGVVVAYSGPVDGAFDFLITFDKPTFAQAKQFAVPAGGWMYDWKFGDESGVQHWFSGKDLKDA